MEPVALHDPDRIDWSAPFWRNVCPEALSGCWLWHGVVKPGSTRGVSSIRGKSQNAARVAWKLCFGEISGGLFVCHRCDVPGCVNPRHLFLGTHLENMADMRGKGRSQAYDRNPRSKLACFVSEIRARSSSGESSRRIAADYGVDKISILRVVAGKTWSGWND